ncbi:MAG TPA: chloride channel protein [Acidiphilium sp.]
MKRNSQKTPRLLYIEPVVMLTTIVQWLILATATGAIVGSGTSLFLHGLFFSIDRTAAIPLWLQMILLPLAGLLNGLALFYGYKANRTGLGDSVIAAVHKQSGRMPFVTIAIKPVAAIITLASGGSAGKEGPCSHIGGSLAAALGEAFGLNPELRKRLVACGVSAGFASVFGTPIAGAIYGVEVLAIGSVRQDFLLPAIIAGIVSFRVSRFWGVGYQYYHIGTLPPFSEALFLKIIVLGIVCGLIAGIFVEAIGLAHRVTTWIRYRFHLWPPLMPLFGGLVLAALILIIPREYLGLSLPVMDRALAGGATPYLGFLWKILLVAVTLGSGFYGGIVTPQFVIGALAGNVLAHIIGIPPVLGAAAGLTAVVAAASNTPIAAILMEVELFNSASGLGYVAAAAIAAYVMIGHRSVYPDQLVQYPKTSWLNYGSGRALSEAKIRPSHELLKWLIRLRTSRGRRWR